MSIVLLVVIVNLAAFFIGGAALFWAYHIRRRNDADAWKHQPRKFQTASQIVEKLPLVLVNGLILNTGIGFGFLAIFSGWTTIEWDATAMDWRTLVIGTIALPFWYHLMLFYVHRAMHIPWLFKRVHYLHHRDKAPMWLDALYEHPIEAAWGAVVIVSPLFLWPIWWWSYIAFFAMVGAHEIIDHAGIQIDLPLLSKSKSHDEHHRRFDCYYGQLLPTLDWLHGTDRLPDRVRKAAPSPSKSTMSEVRVPCPTREDDASVLSKSTDA